MTVFVNFRERAVGGGTTEPSLLQTDGAGNLAVLSEASFLSRLARRDVLFAVHGFNVSRAQGVRAYQRLEAALGLPSQAVFIGVLWPGDSWLPVLNYPFEGSTAMDCGRRLARFCDRKLTVAASLSFVSHSLGARLVLEATQVMRSSTRSVCLTAGAINDDCLVREYAGAFKNSIKVSVLASRRDLVLKLAYPIGDPIADLLHADHQPFTPALGYDGPSRAVGATIPPWQIPDDENYNHSDYFPSGDTNGPDPTGRWVRPVAFMRRAFLNTQQTWP